MGRLLFIVGTAIVLSGCAGISKDQCLAQNWEAAGVEDGAKGISAERIGYYADQCSKYNITVQTPLYLKGHEQGLQRYCTEEQGLSTGQVGSQFNQVCSNFPRYKFGHEAGVQNYCTENRGYNTSRYGDSFNQICSNFLAYENGYEAGLQSYCTEERGFDAGEQGAEFDQGCTGFADYQTGYEDGEFAYKTELRHQELHENYDDALAAYEDVKRRLYDKALVDEERKRLDKKLKRLNRELRRLERELERYESAHNLTCNF